MDTLFKYDPLTLGTKGLVFVGDNVVVLRRDDKTDRFPLHLDSLGGAPEQGETPFDTFQREVKEECNLDIAKKDIVYARRYPSTLEVGRFGYYAIAKLLKEAEGQIKLGNEGMECLVMTLDEYIHRDDAWPVYQQRAADYAKTLE